MARARRTGESARVPPAAGRPLTNAARAREAAGALNRVVNGTSTEVRALARNVDPGVTYRLGVEMTGATITVTVNGNVQFRWTDSAPIQGGALGLRTVAATAFFDHFVADRIA